MRVSLYIQGQKVDLYEDETIDLKSSVQDVNDITKNTTDFTKSFKLPASAINNRLFKHYYDASIENTFDARTKVEARLELDGLVFRFGKLSLLKVDVANNRPSSYNVVFYGNLVNIKDAVGEDYISELDLSAYNHEFTDANVETGLTTGLFDESVIYTLLVKKRYFYDSSSSEHTDTEDITNIAYHNSHGNPHGIRFNDLKPSIKIIRIIEAIENKYDLQFSRDFFGRSLFDKIYMWVNSDSESDSVLFNEIIDFDDGDTTYVDLTTDTGSFSVFYNTSFDYRYFGHSLEVNPSDDTMSYKVKTYVNGSLFAENSYTGTSTTVIDSSNIFGSYLVNGSYDIYYEIEAPINFVYSATWNNLKVVPGDNTSYITTASSSVITGNYRIANALPELKVIDFLKGLFQMFKLVVIQKNSNDPIYINTLTDYYNEGVVYDLTRYIDDSSHTVERGKLLNQITYEFEEPQTILNMEFESNTGLAYGDEQAILETEDGKPIDGSSLEITVPFEQVVYERLTDLNDGVNTNIQYGAIIDDEQKATNIKPHLHYVVNNDISSKTVSFIDSTENEIELDNIYVPSHTLGFETPLHSILFASEYSTYDGVLIENTLYKNWHFDYIKSIFNIKRRTFNYKAFNIPYRYLMSLDLNDVIQIENNYFRINSFNTNLVTNKMTFELINSFDNSLNKFNNNDVVVIASRLESEETVYINNLDNKTISKNAIGFGTDWITTSISGNNLVLDMDENKTNDERYMQIVVEEGKKAKTITVRQLTDG